jgi:hypothetical protein
MILTIRPITSWPGELRTAWDRRVSPFNSSYTDTMDQLDRELRMLRATVTVVQIAVNEGQVRRDGKLRAGAMPDHPGVILSFDTKAGHFRYACDRFTHWHANLRAIALGLEALRKIERYGIGSGTEQYTGYLQLETTPSSEKFFSAATAAEFIARHCGEDASNVRTWWARHGTRYYRTAAAKLHPDASSGDVDLFKRLQAAKSFLDAARD